MNEISQALRRTQMRQYYRWQMEARARAFIAAEITQVLAPIDGRPRPDEPTALVLPAVNSITPDRYETRPMKTAVLPVTGNACNGKIPYSPLMNSTFEKGRTQTLQALPVTHEVQHEQ